MDYPRVLIMIGVFDKQTGGGITLSNLFKEWDRTCIANAITMHSVTAIDSDELYNNYYCLGKDEFKVTFPFSLYFRFRESGRLKPGGKSFDGQINNNNGLKAKIVNGFQSSARSIRERLNLVNFIYSFDPSAGFLQWIKDFKPDYIYIQPSSRYYIKFLKKLHDATGVPLVMHIMDDWQMAGNKNSLFHSYWKKKIDKEFRDLLDSTSVYLSISEGMSKEYSKRYRKTFTPFHNAIDLDHWLPWSKKDYKISGSVKILYAGRIGIGVSEALLDFIPAIEELNLEGYDIRLDIQSTSIEGDLQKKLNFFKCITFNPPVEYEQLAKVFPAYDLLLLPVDFENAGKAFLKYSMPTKTVEFMISGTPILLFCPTDVSLYEDAKNNNWAYIISENKKQAIKKGIKELIADEGLRKRLGGTAVDYCNKHFNAAEVRKKFREMFK